MSSRYLNKFTRILTKECGNEREDLKSAMEDRKKNTEKYSIVKTSNVGSFVIKLDSHSFFQALFWRHKTKEKKFKRLVLYKFLVLRHFCKCYGITTYL